MNEELQKKSLELLERIINAVNSGMDAAPGVLQDLAHEYIRLKLIGPSVGLFASLCVTLVGLKLLSIARNYKKGRSGVDSDFDDGAIAFWTIGTCFVICGAFFLFHNLITVLEISLAPKAYLIEFLRKQ